MWKIAWNPMPSFGAKVKLHVLVMLTSSITVANRSACPAAGPHGPKVGVIGSVIHLVPESPVVFV